uniref:Uncharacterized protein n=1 Tax=Acrobeloides nanus TaxID=290746 RepID=A0A914E6M5_9BILA
MSLKSENGRGKSLNQINDPVKDLHYPPSLYHSTSKRISEESISDLRPESTKRKKKNSSSLQEPSFNGNQTWLVEKQEMEEKIRSLEELVADYALKIHNHSKKQQILEAENLSLKNGKYVPATPLVPVNYPQLLKENEELTTVKNNYEKLWLEKEEEIRILNGRIKKQEGSQEVWKRKVNNLEAENNQLKNESQTLRECLENLDKTITQTRQEKEELKKTNLKVQAELQKSHDTIKANEDRLRKNCDIFQRLENRFMKDKEKFKKVEEELKREKKLNENLKEKIVKGYSYGRLVYEMIVNQICKFSDTSSDLDKFKKKMQSVFSEGPPPTQMNNPLLAAERIMIALLAEYKEKSKPAEPPSKPEAPKLKPSYYHPEVPTSPGRLIIDYESDEEE